MPVEGNIKQRATDFCGAMFDKLTMYLRNVRRVLAADSMIAELQHARDLAKRNLNDASARMRTIEVQFGTYWRMMQLNVTLAGNSTIQRTLEEKLVMTCNPPSMSSRSRKSRCTICWLAGAKDPQHLLVSGGDLLSTPLLLQRLKDGLIDTRIQPTLKYLHRGESQATRRDRSRK